MKKNNQLNNLDSNIWSEIILQGMPEIVYVFNGEGLLIRWNKNAEVILGYSKEEMENKPVLDFIAPQYREKVGEIFFGIYENHKDAKVEYKLLTKSGKQIPYLGSGSYACVDGKDYIIGQAIDISKLKTTEKALKFQIKETDRLKNELYAENIFLKEEIKNRQGFPEIIGESDVMIHLFERIEQITGFDNPVLIEGETGTGKNLIASKIHDLSLRKHKPFMKVNCFSSTSEILKADLFGYVTSSSFGLITEKPGKLELANEGTILLDNIDQMPIDVQTMLLQFIDDEGTIKYQGSNKIVKSNVRILATISKSLNAEIETGQFNKALYFRLNSFSLKIPPLRERMTDIPLLAEYFIAQFNKKYNKNVKKIPIKSMAAFGDYPWPGNIREFKNIIEQSVLLSKNTLLKVASFEKIILENQEAIVPLEQFEREYLIKVLKKTNWRISGPKGASTLLELHPETLRSKLKKLNISKPKV